nr:hypothetical protein GCM10020093_009550 [Planobispora longispora]
MALVGALVPEPTAEDRLAGLLRAQELLHSLGVTAWQDALPAGSDGYPDPSDAYLAAARDGLLTATVVGALWWARGRGPSRSRSCWSGASGSPAAAALRHRQDHAGRRRGELHRRDDLPYLDVCGCATGNSGISFIDPEALKEYVTALDALDFQVHFHALGDRAVREALDAVRAARTANGWRDTRPHLAHLQVVHPDDLPRFRRSARPPTSSRSGPPTNPRWTS